MSRITALSLAVALIAAGPALADHCAGHAKPAAGKDIVATAVAAGQFKTLAAALTKAGLVGALQAEGPFTVFAPTDAAFAKLPAGTVAELLKPEKLGQLKAILTYHVVAGRLDAAHVVRRSGAATLNGQRLAIDASDAGVMVGKAKVVKTDIACSNGVIHVIDTVLLPESKDIVGVAQNAGKFQTLLAAAQAAGLVDALKGEGPLTVFAPTDDAFAKLPKGTVAALLEPENKDKLAAVLLYHVVPGRLYAEQALAAGQATTLQKSGVTIAMRDGQAFVQNARILATDVDASNGVIHVIDTVILPPMQQG